MVILEILEYCLEIGMIIIPIIAAILSMIVLFKKTNLTKLAKIVLILIIIASVSWLLCMSIGMVYTAKFMPINVRD